MMFVLCPGVAAGLQLARIYHPKKRSTHPDKQRRSRRPKDRLRPKIDPSLKPVFRQIGVPESEPFAPDPFQVEALRSIREGDVLVSAPTGAGKTWIALQTIHDHLARNRRVWYASPLKALSNSMYHDFCREFGAATCGILTGDRKENPEAPVIVGTTEILRNQLYDSMHQGVGVPTDLVVLDEAHYLSDPERGVVWEEVLIYLPPRVRLLLLSATVSNGEELCAWMREVRGVPNRVVRSHERPVPLEMLFLFPDGLIAPLAGKRGLNPRVRKFVSVHRGRKGRPRTIDFAHVLSCLRAFDLLPAIFFLKSRSDCDHAVLTLRGVERPSHWRKEFRKTLADFLEEYPHLRHHRQLDSLVDSLVGSHHGGQLPFWKVLIERLMTRGFLDAIFSTSTVAAGVNFPARTVVLVQSDRFNGRDFTDLTAMEFHQMVGRAGRRGKDHIGFALVLPGPHQDVELLRELRDSPPEPVTSQIHINFSMTLNLLLSHTPEEVKGLLERSFAAFQERGRKGPLSARWDDILQRLQRLLPQGQCNLSDPYELMETIQKRAEYSHELKRATVAAEHTHRLNEYRKLLTRGRLFRHGNRNLYVAFHTSEDRGRFYCSACNVNRSVGQGRRVRLKRVYFDQIKAVYDYRIDPPDDISPIQLQLRLEAIPLDELQEVAMEPYEGGEDTEYVSLLRELLRSLPCESCVHTGLCHKRTRSGVRALLRDVQSLTQQMDGVKGGLWVSFKRHVRFLQENRFVDEDHRLTPDGYWASKLRLDQPLLIAEAIRRGAMDAVTPAILAGSLAPFVWDKPQEILLHITEAISLGPMEETFHRVLEEIRIIRTRKAARGFESPPILFWPAVALYGWSKGMGWDQLLALAPVDEGDMASLIMRTADHLRQVTNLAETHPRLAATAEEAIRRIQREPVYLY